MENNKSSDAKRVSLFAAGALMMVCAFLYWICGIGTVFALCLAASGLCFFAAGLNTGNQKKN